MPATMQELSDYGLNPFAIQLLVESCRKSKGSFPVEFVFGGYKIKIEAAEQQLQPDKS